jgi:hypothetical protein
MRVNGLFEDLYSFRSERSQEAIQFALPPGFYVKCEVFKSLNLVNNILNNGLFLIISVFVDIFMIRYSNKVVNEKKAISVHI